MEHNYEYELQDDRIFYPSFATERPIRINNYHPIGLFGNNLDLQKPRNSNNSENLSKFPSSNLWARIKAKVKSSFEDNLNRIKNIFASLFEKKDSNNDDTQLHAGDQSLRYRAHSDPQSRRFPKFDDAVRKITHIRTISKPLYFDQMADRDSRMDSSRKSFKKLLWLKRSAKNQVASNNRNSPRTIRRFTQLNNDEESTGRTCNCLKTSKRTPAGLRNRKKIFLEDLLTNRVNFAGLTYEDPKRIERKATPKRLLFDMIPEEQVKSNVGTSRSPLLLTKGSR